MTHIRHAVRTLAKHPGTTSVVVVTIAVAIAAMTVIYSAIDVVWGFFPVADRAGLVYAAATDTRVLQIDGVARSVVLRTRVSTPDLADWSARQSTFEELAGFELNSANLTGIAVPLRVSSVRATANLVRMWGIAPVEGRAFRQEDALSGAAPVVLLTYGFWQRQFASDAAVIGRTLLFDGVAHTVVGILPPETGTGLFRDVDVFLPLVLDPLRGDRRQRTILVTGRLRPGVTREQATADLDGIARQLQTEYPETNQGMRASVLPLIEASGFNVRILISILALIGGLVLVVACANVSGVLIAQSLSRRHELAVRAALGEGRFDRLRQSMAESMLLSALACVLGLILAAWGIDALRALGGDSFGLAGIRMNGRVLAAGLLTALAAPLGFGLIPALRPVANPQELKDGARAGIESRGRRARTVLVALQSAAAVVLMLQIGLLVRTTWQLSTIETGFDPAQVLTFRVGLSGAQYEQTTTITRFSRELLSRLRAIPGVASAATIDRLPVADREATARLTVEGAVPARGEEQPSIARTAISGDYFATMRIPIKRGRPFSAAEMAVGSPVAVINEEAARRFWPGHDPIGARLALDAPPGGEAWLQVVGVVGNLRNSDIDQGPLPQAYIAASRAPSGDIAVVVRSTGSDPMALVSAIRSEVAGLDRNQPIHDVATMAKVLFDDLAGTYVLTALLTAIALIALCLSAAGVYGLVAYSVAQRAREIGLRVALGANPGMVVRMVIATGAKPVTIGSLGGLVIAALLAFVIGLSVPGVEARDPGTYAAVTMTMVIVALAASYLPARRAAFIDPAVTLRQ